MNTCDIIIPTFNGREKLSLSLPTVLSQDIPSNWQVRVVVCDDGSSQPLPIFPSNVVVVQNTHVGRAGIRNRAITESSADILLFLADDILLAPNAIAEHLAFHAKNSDFRSAALGFVVWDPRIRPTPFMEWMTHGGQQNDFDSLLGALSADPEHFFYGSFISVKRALFQYGMFSEHFHSYGWEDLELGARLAKVGCTLSPLHRAKAFHRHFYSAQHILSRARLIGTHKYRVNTNRFRKIKHMLYRIVGVRNILLLVMKKWGNQLNVPTIFQIVTAGEFWYGVYNPHKVLISPQNKNSSIK